MIGKRWRVTFLTLTVLAGLALTAGPASASVYWGASVGPQYTGEQAPWDMDAVGALESAVGKEASIVHYFSPFADCTTDPCEFKGFDVQAMDLIRDHGSIPMLSWASQATAHGLGTGNQPYFQLRDVLDGTHDGYIRTFARDAADWGHPFFLRLNHEMNARWFQWSEHSNGNSPGEYVDAWRHVHDIFEEEGASNATWVWCPNVDPDDAYDPLAPLYPGDDYVDWTCLDGYNYGTRGAGGAGAVAWRTFDDLFGKSYDEVTDLAPSKPMMVGEIASTQSGGDKAGWTRESLERIPAVYPAIRAVVWFDRVDDGMDWPISTSPASTRAFASGIGCPVYEGASFGSIEGKVEPPPGADATSCAAAAEAAGGYSLLALLAELRSRLRGALDALLRLAGG
jgi:hypothetical protein